MNLLVELAVNYFLPTSCFFAHELHGLTRRQCATGMATGSVALIGTNAMRGSFTCPVA